MGYCPELLVRKSTLDYLDIEGRPFEIKATIGVSDEWVSGVY
jgi:hypothetical protein